MIGLYAFYLKEREDMECLEKEAGFAVYKLMGDKVYIRDIYVIPKMRESKLASQMADEITEIAKAQGCKQLVGSVAPQDKSATRNMKVLLSYGFKLSQASETLLLFTKEI